MPDTKIQEACDGVRALLALIDEDPMREGIIDTPKRVVKAMLEMTSGYKADLKTILATTFDSNGYDEVIAVNNIDFVSMCEHHLLPFTGSAFVAYLPAKVDAGYRVVGLSKIPRLVDAFAHRLQLQEQMTMQIATSMVEHLDPRGVGVVVTAEHSCMSCRGVRKSGANMVTSAMMGSFRHDPTLRAEVFRLFEK